MPDIDTSLYHSRLSAIFAWFVAAVKEDSDSAILSPPMLATEDTQARLTVWPSIIISHKSGQPAAPPSPQTMSDNICLEVCCQYEEPGDKANRCREIAVQILKWIRTRADKFGAIEWRFTGWLRRLTETTEKQNVEVYELNYQIKYRESWA